ncbi:response regulator [Piscinibacter terrae]|uniref:DNA-binding response regulator n=1 Tax=Piscinibacter terrae TaxID=2496871 RepID=A0A3N7HS50_9BURK|nr:response regulator transcription factor [Albitalea terrae]RQP24583.1 DNA-binding response regulator [Albitalea terrae]
MNGFETAPRVLIVDDDPAVCEMLSDLCDVNGLAATAVADGAAMHEALAAGPFELLLMDLRLKKEDGLALARTVRETSDIPIIIMTGKGDEIDRILGLELVADDYLHKPFNPREVMARVRAVLRRAHLLSPRAEPPSAAAASTPARAPIRFGGLTLDLDARQLLGPDGEPRRLTAYEFSLLEVFVQNVNRVLTRDQLLEGMRRHDTDVLDRAIDVLILRLRRKIEPNASAPQFIRTERGYGYVFSLPTDDPARR